MYSQYQSSSYQQQYPTSSSGVGGAMLATAAAAPAMVWNGSSWQPAGAGGAAGSTTFSATAVSSSAYHQHQQQAAAAPPSSSSSPATTTTNNANLVQLYSQYYHGYTALAREEGESLPRLRSAEERREALGRQQWYKYYADQSSLAAHHFASNAGSQVAPFELPPAPPVRPQPSQPPANAAAAASASAAHQPHPSQQQRQQSTVIGAKQQQRQQTSSSTGTTLTTTTGKCNSTTKKGGGTRKHKAPGGMKVFVDRCLSLCTDGAERNRMAEKVEDVITDLAKRGALHTTDWSALALPSLQPSDTTATTTTTAPAGLAAPSGTSRVSPPVNEASAASAGVNVQQQQNGQYGRAISLSPTSGGGTSASSSVADRAAAAAAAYYGPPPPSSHKNDSVKDHQHHGQHQGKHHHHHHGQRSSSDLPGSYYGPPPPSSSTTATAPSSKISRRWGDKNHNQQLDAGGGGCGYYGPSSTSEPQVAAVGPISSSSSRWDRGPDHMQQNYQQHRHQHRDDGSANSGSANSGGSNTKKRKKKDQHNQHKQKLAQNDSYYGPSSTTSSSSPQISSLSLTFSQQQQQQDGFAAGLDFVTVPQTRGGHPNKKAKVSDRSGKKSGFNQTSSAMDDRAKRFSGPGGNDAVVAFSSSQAAPGYARYMGQGIIGGASKLDESDYEMMKVKGTCQTLEKEYLRLTAPPKAELVRPQPILKRHLENLKEERERVGDGRRDYQWFCSQLKAVRQDCTVQHLQNVFVVDVYETHARIALEEGDLNEYNQCQTQLRDLYKTLREKQPEACQNQNEFIAYRLLYYVFLTGNKTYDGGSSDLFKIMLSLSPEQRQDPSIQHALSVREHVADTDYHAFFLLRRKCPNLGSFLMDRIVPSMRQKALLRICKSYRPSVEVEFVLLELGFESDLEFGIKWLVSCGCILSDDKAMVMTKDSIIQDSNLETKKSLI